MNKPILYCVAILKFINNQWIGDFEYLHATCQGEARVKYTAANSNDIINGKIKLTGIAPVVGYFEDEQNKIYV